jgi:DNA polymerase/3'-5' exonuclease PolX
MTVHNADIAAIFEEIAELLEIQNENPFRIRAYRNAARQVEGMGVALSELVARGEDLTALPGIGEDLAAKIREIVETSKCKALEKLRQQLPPTITELLRIPGLGPKRVRALHDRLKVKSVEQLAQAAQAGKIRELEGFGTKTEQTILEALAAHVTEQKRFKLAIAAQYAEPLRQYLEKSPGVDRAVIAGSYGRRPRHPGHGTQRAGGHAAIHRLRRGRQGARARRHPLDRNPQVRAAGRPAGGGTGELRRGPAVLHRLQGAQHRDPPPRPRAETQDQ